MADQAIIDCMVETVRVRRPLSLSPQGAPVLDAAVPIRAYLEKGTRRTAAAMGTGPIGASTATVTIVITDGFRTDVDPPVFYGVEKSDSLYLPGEDVAATKGAIGDGIDELPDIQAGPGVLDHYEITI